MKEKLVSTNVIFKIRQLDDETIWEYIEPLGMLAMPIYSWEEIDDLALKLSLMYDGVCRWNYEWSQQGHYRCHQKVWQDHQRWKKQLENKEAQDERA